MNEKLSPPIHNKSLDQLKNQVAEVNKLRALEERNLFYPNLDDFNKTEGELREIYGEQYEEYKKDLGSILYQKIVRAKTEDELLSDVKKIIGQDGAQKISKQIKKEENGVGIDSMPLKKRIAFTVVAAFITATATGAIAIGMQEIRGRARSYYELGVGKNNPILAAQSSDGLVFKADNGVEMTGENYGNVEQVLLHPSSQSKQNEIDKTLIENNYRNGRISFLEHRNAIWEVEGRKKQGFLDAYEKRFIFFEELVEQILEKGERGVKTTLNFGDSSTSGWNSNVLTENARMVASELFDYLRAYDTSLPKTFEEYAAQIYPKMYNYRQHTLAFSLAAEQVKNFAHFQEIYNRHWDTLRKKAKSPLMTYDTYVDMLAQINPNQHQVNLGIPGFTTVHAKAYTRRMIDQLKNHGALQYVDRATLYFGNNDSVNNGNRQDKFAIGDDMATQFYANGITREDFPNIFNQVRVNIDDFERNLQTTINNLKEEGIQNITVFTPIIPFNWIPGQRAANDAQEVINEQYKKGGIASRELDKSKKLYADYLYEKGDIESGDIEKARELAKMAIERDFMIPRIKRNYVKMAATVAQKEDVTFINIEGVLPIKDMSQQYGEYVNPKDPNNIANDYCHPAEHANILLGFAQAYAYDSESNILFEKKALTLLIDLGINKELAKKEIEKIKKFAIVKNGDSQEAYEALANIERTRADWQDRNF